MALGLLSKRQIKIRQDYINTSLEYYKEDFSIMENFSILVSNIMIMGIFILDL